MGKDRTASDNSTIHRLDAESLARHVRDAAQAISPDRYMDDLEVRHLVRVITECSLLLTDVYSEERLARIMHPERGFLTSLVDRLIEEQRRGEGEALYRVRRLPDDVRMIGDKALFDMGLLGQRQIKGYDIEDLGARAYGMAGEVLELLADDRRLREFFDENRLLALPLDEEVVFLRQCSDRFRLYAEILKRSHSSLPAEQPDESQGLVPRHKTTAVLAATQDTAYLEAAQEQSPGVSTDVPRNRVLSNWERMLIFADLDMAQIQGALDATVIDQQQAVQQLCDEFSLFAAGTRNQSKPPAYFLVGPTGVGKNHLIERLASLLEGVCEIEVPVLTIEGPNYTYPSDINELKGATRGFIRSDEEGILTSFHQRSSSAPFSVILIDEVEKAHPQLLTFFLSILDRGTTTDNRGTVLDFSNCMLFFTSNLGYSDEQQRNDPIGFADSAERDQRVDQDIRRDLRKSLKPEFVNRVKMIHFNRLTRSSIDRILDLEFDKIAARYERVHDLRICLDGSARDELIRVGFSATYGARHLAAVLDAVCNVEIAKRVRKDDRSEETDRQELIHWLRELKSGERPFDANEVERRVLASARAKLPYGTLKIVFRDGDFEYLPVNDNSVA